MFVWEESNQNINSDLFATQFCVDNHEQLTDMNKRALWPFVTHLLMYVYKVIGKHSYPDWQSGSYPDWQSGSYPDW